MTKNSSERDEVRSPRRRMLTPMGAVLILLIFTLIASNVALMQQNRLLKQSLKLRSEPAFLLPGQALSTLRGIDLSGEERTLELAHGQKTILFVFHPQCQWCRKNMDNWAALKNSTNQEHYRFLAVSTRPDGVPDYVDGYPVFRGMSVIADPHLDDRMRYRLFDTPQTIVINGDGVVEKIWLGALDGRLKQDAEAYFGFALPGASS